MSNICRADDEVTEAEWVHLELSRLDAEGNFTKDRVMDLLLSIPDGRIVGLQKGLKRAEAASFAVSLLRAGARVAAVRDRLLSGCYCGSKNAAYRVIHIALSQRSMAMRTAFKHGRAGASPTA